MTNCTYCGSSLLDGAKTCPKCQHKQDKAPLPLTPSGTLPMPPGLGLPPVGPDLILGAPPEYTTQLDPASLGLDFYALRILQGQSYRLEFSSSQPPTLNQPFSILCCMGGEFSVVDYAESSGSYRLIPFSPSGKPTAPPVILDAGCSSDLSFPCAAMDASGMVYLQFPAQPDLTVIAPGSQQLPKKLACQLAEAQDLTCDARGSLYIADTGNHRVLCLDSGGAIKAEYPSASAMLPTSACADHNGRVLVADADLHCVHVFQPTGTRILSFGQPGTLAAQFTTPFRVRVDAQNNIYVADLGGERIQKFMADGTFVYQLYLPAESGGLADFQLDGNGHILAALPMVNLVLGLSIT